MAKLGVIQSIIMPTLHLNFVYLQFFNDIFYTLQRHLENNGQNTGQSYLHLLHVNSAGLSHIASVPLTALSAIL